MVSAPTGAHAVRAMLMNPRLGPTPLAEISTIIGRCRRRGNAQVAQEYTYGGRVPLRVILPPHIRRLR